MDTPPSKPAWQSKTIWIAALVAVAPLYPPFGAIVAANPAMVSAAVGALFAGLRAISGGAINLGD